MARLAKTGSPSGTRARVPSRAGGGAWRVTASAESLGGTGSCGHPIVGNGYSELSTVPMGTASDFVALGNIPCGTILRITNPANGKQVDAAKQDVGAGSPGFLPVMGLYPTTVQTLGLSGGEFHIIIERTDGGTLAPVRGTPAGAGAGSSTGTAGAATPSSGSGSPSLLGTLSDLVTGNISDLAANLAIMVATGIKDAAVSIYDSIIVPTWHRNQQAVWWYTSNVLFPTKAKGSTSTGGKAYVAWQTWPANAAFWGFGYGLLFTDPTTGSLKPVPPRQSRIARHVRATQGLPARQALIKPSKVLEKTPKKPMAKPSKVAVSQVASMNTHRRGRPVQLTGDIAELDRELSPKESDDRQRNGPTRERPTIPAVDSETRVRQVRRVKATEGGQQAQSGGKGESAKSYPHYPGRLRPRTDSGDNSKTPTDQRQTKGSRPRRRGIPTKPPNSRRG